jgi:hypothetical protein
MDPIKQFQKIHSEISKNVSNLKWECLVEGCQENAINSHLLQKNGILNSISENGHIIELKKLDYFKWSPNKPPITLKKTGINKAFSLPVFCSQHDSSKFKSLESTPQDFFDYTNQLLLSYRVVCAEIRKKEINIEIDKRTLNSNILRRLVDLAETKVFMEGTIMGKKELFRYKQLFENELQNPSGQFLFESFTYPLIKVYCSGTFSPMKKITKDMNQIDPLNSVFIHVIPYNQKLNIVVGYHRNYNSDWIINFTKGWQNLRMDKLEENLTNLFATRIENWGISPAIYNNIPQKSLNIFLKYFFDNTLNHSEDQKLNINVFEGKNYGT